MENHSSVERQKLRRDEFRKGMLGYHRRKTLTPRQRRELYESGRGGARR